MATDKLLALIGQTPPSVGVVIMPSEAERAERRAMHDKLDDLARRLAGNASPQRFRSRYLLAVNPQATNLQSSEESLEK
jgi:hypothetical protein